LYYIYKIKYEWDEAKRKSNLAKHGLDFADAWRVIEGDGSITVEDLKHSQSELRYRTIGFLDGVLCVAVVIHTERQEKKRIISFRYAHKKEKDMLWQSKAIRQSS
jgi:uncharacterized DUF497 family protein